MAKILFGEVVAAASGRVDGIVYSHNRAGAYVRSHAQNVNPNTPRQQAARNALQSLSSAWRSLTENQRLGWSTLGLQMTRKDRVGNTVTLTGAQAFQSCNNALVRADEGYNSVAPPLVQVDQIQPAVVVLDATPTFTIDPNANMTADDYCEIWASAPVSQGRNFFRPSDYKLLLVVAGNTSSAQNVLNDYEALFGAQIASLAGNKISVKTRMRSELGFYGAFNRVDTTIAVAP